MSYNKLIDFPLNEEKHTENIIKEEKLIITSQALLQPYTNIIDKNNTVNLIINQKSFTIPTISYYKICDLISLYPEENIRFTLYIDEPKSTLIIPDYSLYNPIEKDPIIKSLPGQINPAIFILSRTNSFMFKIYRVIYPLLFIFAFFRCIHLYNISKEKVKLSLKKYELTNSLMIILISCIGVYGIYQMRNWKVKHFLLLNILLIICLLVSGICFYFPMSSSISKEVEAKYYQQNKGFHYFFFIMLFIIEITAILLNILIKKEYQRFLGTKYNNKLSLNY